MYCKIPEITVRVQSQNTGSKLDGLLGPNRAWSKEGYFTLTTIYIKSTVPSVMAIHVYILCPYSNWGWQNAALGWQCRQYMFALCVCMVIGDIRGQHWDGRGVWAVTSGMCNWDGRGKDYQIIKLCEGVKTMKVANPKVANYR